MINAVIIDDEQNNIENLELLLAKHCPQVNVIGSALNATKGGQLIRQQCHDLVFLDIQMPCKNGFEMLKALDHYDFGSSLLRLMINTGYKP